MADGRIRAIHSSEQFKNEIKEATGLVVVDWSATWCGPCKNIYPVLVKYSEEYPHVLFLKVDVDENKDLAKEYEIRAMPTFFFFRNGEKIDSVRGADPNALGSMIEKYQVKSWGSGNKLGAPTTSTPSPVQPQATVEPLDVLVNNLLDMGFDYDVAKQALAQTNNAGLEQAIDWIDSHPEGLSEDAGDVQVMETDSPAALVLPSEPNVGSTNSEESQKSWEEREARIKERIKQANEERKKREEAADQEREINRVKNAQLYTKTKRMIDDQKEKDEIRIAKKKKAEERKAKLAIKAKIQAAKEERMRKQGRLSTIPVEEGKVDKKEEPEVAERITKEYTSCALALRLPSGQTVKQDFLPTDTLQTVRNFVTNSCGISGSFNIIASYPRKVYDSSLFSKTLQELDLVPRSALLITNP